MTLAPVDAPPSLDLVLFPRALVSPNVKATTGSLGSFGVGTKRPHEKSPCGAAQFELKRYDEAINDCTEAIRLDPKRGSAYTRRAVALKAKGDIDRAMADFAEVRRLKLGGQ